MTNLHNHRIIIKTNLFNVEFSVCDRVHENDIKSWISLEKIKGGGEKGHVINNKDKK